MVNIIGDIAGQYDALMALVDKMPEGEIISVGDMVDRGPNSSKVIEYFMQPGRRAILGNHEHMMIDYLTRGSFYGRDIWFYNGGGATMRSYPDTGVPDDHLEWLQSLPKFIEIDDVLISHAFLRPSAVEDRVVLEHNCEFGSCVWDKDETTIIWNRSEPVRRDTWKLQVCGHNSQFGLREWRDEQGLYAICLDDSRKGVLTGLHLPTMEIFQQEYL